MIRITMARSNGKNVGFDCTGHAGFAEEGKDIAEIAAQEAGEFVPAEEIAEAIGVADEAVAEAEVAEAVAEAADAAAEAATEQ